MQRYFLCRASMRNPFTGRELQSGKMRKVTELLILPYCMFGQVPAVEPHQKNIVNRLSWNNDDPGPLVMVFARPPSHGKMSWPDNLDLINTNHDIIPCSHIKTHTEPFDSKQGCQRSTISFRRTTDSAQLLSLMSLAKPYRKHVSPS
jgi:hypothetical protein